jgi:hypothetical protein
MLDKTYFDKPQRFWFKSGVKEFILNKINDTETKADLALVTGEFSGAGKLILDYDEKKPDSIMKNYFLLLANEGHYTIIDSPITPEEYSRLRYCRFRYNGDLYHIAEIDGYNPAKLTPAKLKLIKEIM